MYALVSGFSDAGNSIVSAGQAHTVYGAASSVAQEAAKGDAKLRGARVVCDWLDSSRPGRPTQSYAGMVG
jgi:hypothetical protein